MSLLSADRVAPFPPVTEFLVQVLRPSLAVLTALGGPKPSDRAERMLLAIGLQESRLIHRFQVLSGGRPGPARGFWQFEAGGGVKGVLLHPASSELALTLCAASLVTPDPQAVWRAIEGNDALAGGFARLLLWTDPGPLPSWNDADAAWDYYVRNWRPGKPHRATWNVYWQQAGDAVLSRPISYPHA